MRNYAPGGHLKFLIKVCAWFFFLLANTVSFANEPQSSYPSEAPLCDQSDPLEGLNRAMFVFNDKIDIFLVKPIALLYNKIIPKPLNQGINNIYNNINGLPTIANDLLQLHFYQMLHDTWRFGVNTTIGIGGLFDIGSRIGLEQNNNDFGLTLARYGWNNSTFLVLPFFGPCTVRDGIEIPVDYYFFMIYPYIYPPARRYELFGLGIINRRAQLLQFESVMEEAAIDKYVFVRNAYLQRRAFQIEQVKNCPFFSKDQPTPTTLPIQESAKPVSQSIGALESGFVTLKVALDWRCTEEDLLLDKKTLSENKNPVKKIVSD